uniref:Uncharacterized protein n=1 Tax=Oryza glumipatula TaxID=40148 RepID=A0A0E0BS42_9ORYZ
MEDEWPYPLLSKEIDARHRAKKISHGNSCSSLVVLIPRTAGWQKRQADNRYRRSMHSRMTPWIEAWSQALNDVTRIRLLAPEDPDERGPPTIDQIYDMRLALPAHLTTDIAGELVRDAKTLWEKLRDGMAGTKEEVMATVDSLRRKGNDGRAGVRSTSFREPQTIPTIPEITEISERLGGFGSTQAQPERVPTHSSTPITTQWQGGFALFAGPTQSVPLHAPTYGTNPWQGQSMDYGGSFRPELMSGFRPYTASYGDMSSFGGGSSSVPNELWTSQTDDAPPVTQPT